MLTVVCVKWGDKYGPRYVSNLESMCRRHLPSHAFVCFTENPVSGVFCRPLPSTLPSWWSKVGLFMPGLLAGDVLYLDLDVVITRDLFGLVQLLEQDRTKLWALDDFSYSLVNPKPRMSAETRRLLGGDGTINSSVMMWHGNSCAKVWDEFTVEKMDEVHGDQNWITQALWPHINLIPSEWASSYKYGGSGAIRIFHGNPKPPDVAEQWVTDNWR